MYALTTRVLCVDFFSSPLSDPRFRLTVASGQGKRSVFIALTLLSGAILAPWLAEFLFKQPSCGGDQTIAHLNCYRVYCLTHTLMGVSALRSPHQDSKVSPFFHMKLVGTNSRFSKFFRNKISFIISFPLWAASSTAISSHASLQCGALSLFIDVQNIKTGEREKRKFEVRETKEREEIFYTYWSSKDLCVCLTLCDPTDVARQAPLSMGFSRQEYWSGVPFPPPGDLPDPGVEPPFPSPALQADSLPLGSPSRPRDGLYSFTRIVKRWPVVWRGWPTLSGCSGHVSLLVVLVRSDVVVISAEWEKPCNHE